MKNTTAAKKSTVLDAQKAIGAVRKAAVQAKTRLNDAKRDVTSSEQGLAYASSRPVGTTEYDNAAALARWVSEQKERLESAQRGLVKAEANYQAAQAELAAAEAKVVKVTTAFDSVLVWFSGASLINARAALELLDASIKLGCWIPGASRKVRAAMGKANVARKQIKTDRSYSATKISNDLDSAIRYGAFHKGFTTYTAAELATVTLEAQAYITDMAPVVAAMNILDATRPVAQFTLMNASPLISSHLKTLGVTAVEICPMERKRIEEKDAKGNVTYRWVWELVWPAGTKHHTSKFAFGTNHNAQCHACGHAIKNAFNWVPMVLTTKAGLASYWVGRDCAETLFGVKLTGELEIVGDTSR